MFPGYPFSRASKGDWFHHGNQPTTFRTRCDEWLSFLDSLGAEDSMFSTSETCDIFVITNLLLSIDRTVMAKCFSPRHHYSTLPKTADQTISPTTYYNHYDNEVLYRPPFPHCSIQQQHGSSIQYIAHPITTCPHFCARRCLLPLVRHNAYQSCNDDSRLNGDRIRNREGGRGIMRSAQQRLSTALEMEQGSQEAG